MVSLVRCSNYEFADAHSNRGCVTPTILSQLATVNLDNVAGFQDLMLAVHPPLHTTTVNHLTALKTNKKFVWLSLCVALTLVTSPLTARPVQPARLETTAEIKTQSNGKKKRKADEQISLSSTAATASHSVAPALAQPSEEEMNEEVAEEEARDELYCTMHTNVVGIQYYQGWVYGFLCLYTDFSYH